MNSHANPERDALASVTDLIKVMTSLATGALVFSIGFARSSDVALPFWIKVCLVATWLLLFSSVAAGIYVHGQIPRQIQQKNYDIGKPELLVGAILMEVCFVLGVFGIAATLITSLFAANARNTPAVATPMAALVVARQSVASAYRITAVDSIGLMRNIDATRAENAAWHVRFEVRPKGKAAPAQRMDVYVDPTTGQSSSLSTP